LNIGFPWNDPPDGYQHGYNSTNSGKTTTLHSLLSHINPPQRKIWTVEDPIEKILQGHLDFKQVQAGCL